MRQFAKGVFFWVICYNNVSILNSFFVRIYKFICNISGFVNF